MNFRKIRIGDLLIQKGLITEAQLKVALEEQKVKKERLGDILVQLGYITEKRLLEVLAEQLKVKIISDADVKANPELRKLISEDRARRLQILPVKVEGNLLHIATTDPTNVIALDEISRITHKM